MPARARAGGLGGPKLLLGELHSLGDLATEVATVGPAVGVDDAVLDLLHLVEDGGDEVHATSLNNIVTRGGVASVSYPWILIIN